MGIKEFFSRLLFLDIYNQDKQITDQVLEDLKNLRSYKNIIEDQKVRKRELADGCRIEAYLDKRGFWRWRLKAANHRIIAESGEGYINRQNMEKSLTLIRNIMDLVAVVYIDSAIDEGSSGVV